MRKITKITKIFAVALCCIMLVGSLTACSGVGNNSAAKPESESTSPKEHDSTDTINNDNNRMAISEQLSEIENQYNQNPDDLTIALQYAQNLYALGYFEKSQMVLNPLLEKESTLPEAIYLAAQIEYLNGQYDKSEELYLSLVEKHNSDYGVAAQVC